MFNDKSQTNAADAMQSVTTPTPAPLAHTAESHSFVGMGARKPSQHVSVRSPMRGTENLHEFEMIDVDSKPSWKHSGTGSASLRAQIHSKAGWIQFTVRETPETSRGGKEVHIALNPEAAKALTQFLTTLCR